MDSFGRIMEIIITVVLLFIVPLYIIAGIREISNQIYINTQTTLFTDTVRNCGYIDEDMYNSYVNALGVTDNVYDVKMIHSCQMYDSNYDRYYMEYHNEEILNGVISGGYYMNQGDLFNVNVVSKGGSLFNKMTSLIMEAQNDSVLVCYGGIIRDEAY